MVFKSNTSTSLIMMTIVFVAVFILIIGNVVDASNVEMELPIVRVEQGQIRGTSYSLYNGENVHAFYGVPYAAAPIFKYRFKEPHPVKPWVGIWNASVEGSICFQYNHVTYSVLGEEDCLYLNIFTPKLPQNGVSQLMDVIVYIHGGAFMFGSGSSMLPDFLMERGDVVYVTMNYRLGPLGFFSTGDDVVAGNNGLKDQVAALKWIQHNIIKFGGNPASITLMGMSAGGASVHYHYLSPISEGLFQRGISLSGSVFPPWTLPPNVTEKSIELASILGCPTNNTRDMVKCLQKRPAKQIVEAVASFFGWRYSPFTPFGPVVEPTTSLTSFLNAHPTQIISSGRFTNLPWLVSTNKDEGLYPAAEFIHSDEYINELDQRWYEIAPYLLDYNYLPDPAKKQKISTEVRKFYFQDRTISKNVLHEIIRMISDRTFLLSMRQATKLHAANSKAPVYCYRFNYRGKYSLSKKYSRNDENYGVSHGDDLQYILNVYYSNATETEHDLAMIDVMASFIISFIKSGKPVIANVEWPPVSPDQTLHLNCLSIDSPTKLSVQSFDDSETYNLWSTLLPNEYVEPFHNNNVHDEL